MVTSQHQQSSGGNDSKTNLQSKALTTFHQHLEPGTSIFSELICKLIFGTKILSCIPNFQTLVLLAGLMMQTVLLYPFSLSCITCSYSCNGACPMWMWSQQMFQTMYLQTEQSCVHRDVQLWGR